MTFEPFQVRLMGRLFLCAENGAELAVKLDLLLLIYAFYQSRSFGYASSKNLR